MRNKHSICRGHQRRICGGSVVVGLQKRWTTAVLSFDFYSQGKKYWQDSLRLNRVTSLARAGKPRSEYGSRGGGFLLVLRDRAPHLRLPVPSSPTTTTRTLISHHQLLTLPSSSSTLSLFYSNQTPFLSSGLQPNPPL